MNIEMKMLAWTIVLGLVQIALVAMLSTQQRGLAWNVGPRDGLPVPLTGVAARMDRALHNLVETFPFFAAAVLAVSLTQTSNADTAMGAQLYFWARVAFVVVYAAGISYVRTLVWGASIVGLVMVMRPLF